MKKIVMSIALIAGFTLSAVEQKNIVEAIFRALKPIETNSSLMLSKITNVQSNTTNILQIIEDLNPAWLSLTELLLSQIAMIDMNFSGTIIVNNDPVLSAVAVIESQIEVLSDCCSTTQEINTNLNILTDQSSINDALILSAIDQTCDLAPVISQLDVISSQIAELASSSGENLCGPLPIISGPTTISSAGYYCLASNSVSSVTIAASNVVLDLNNHQLTNGIAVNSGLDQIAIRNGYVQGNGGSGNGITIDAATSNVVIENVTIKNALVGIQFNNNDIGGSVAGCTMTANEIGLQLNGTSNIVVTDCVATGNNSAGFDLISSTTNSFINCKALSTGQNNTTTFNNSVTGFIAENGYGNIFERCIANSTQALSTTDSNSLVAGFALAGSEMGSKIINCESANATTSPYGYTIPYGVLLQAMVDNCTSVTGALTNSNDIVFAVNWSPDGQYLAIGGDIVENDDNLVQIFSFNRALESLTFITGALTNPIDEVTSVNWSPDGQYLAIGGDGIVDNGQLQIFSFNRVSGSLAFITGALTNPIDEINSVNWSPDGQYLAIGGNGITENSGNQLQIFSFNRVSGSLAFITGALTNPIDEINSVNWSPDGQYLAIGGNGITENSGNQLQIFSFNRASGSLTFITGALPTSSDIVSSVNWSPDGQYLAIGGTEIMDNTGQLQIFNFNRASGSLTFITGVFTINTEWVFAVNWSSDGQYLAIGGFNIALTDNGGNLVQIFSFNRSSESLTFITGALTIFSDQVLAVNWSPDGQYLAIGGTSITENYGNQFQLFVGLEFPTHNVINNNTVYNNSGGIFPSGCGISGPSICNMIIGNNCYSNPIPAGINAPIVSSNYYFVCNVFNQLYGQIPSALQNIGLGGCAPIATPSDLNLVVQQNLYLLNSVIAMLASI